MIDDESGIGVGGASVWVVSEGGPALLGGASTSVDGTFSIEVRPCGVVEVRTRHIGYADHHEILEFAASGQLHQLTVRLERSPLEVEELLVEVPTSLRLQEVGFYARKSWEESTGRDYGEFYDPDEVAGRSASYNSVGGMALAARILFMYPPSNPFCRAPSFYVDGRRFERRYDFMGWLDHRVKLGDVEGLEIYRPAHAAIPDEFREANSNTCGLVLIWTKDGGEDVPRVQVELCEASGVVDVGGVVSDRLTGVRLPAAYVTMVGESDSAPEVHTIADAEGRYRYCDVAATPVTVYARYGDAVGDPRAVSVATAAAHGIDLEVPATVAGAIVGRLVGASGPIAGAMITLEATDHRTTTDPGGHFELADLPPGDYQLLVAVGDSLVIRRGVTVRAEHTERLLLQIGG